MSKKNIVVTGGTKGIGKAIVLKFASNGFNIFTCARNSKDLKQLELELSQFADIEVLTVMADLSIEADCKKFVSAILEKTTEIDVLVNNTGVFIPGQIHLEEEGVLQHMLNTNLLSTYHITRGLINTMILNKKGHVFNINSTASITPYQNGGSYCITKYAMHGLTKVLREEMKPFGIKVTSIMPGATFTSSWDGIDLPLERFMLPDDVSEVIWSAFNLSTSAVVEEILLRPQLGDIG